VHLGSFRLAALGHWLSLVPCAENFEARFEISGVLVGRFDWESYGSCERWSVYNWTGIIVSMLESELFESLDKSRN
jgi:hypothetical protein